MAHLSRIDWDIIHARVCAAQQARQLRSLAVATNSQARIQSRDLRANHPILKKLELAFAERGYYFERKRNMHADREASRRIDALRLGQIILAFYLREPERSKTDSDSIFDHRFSTIFHDRYDMDELCRLFELYRALEEMREDYVATHGGNFEGGGDIQYLVYGNWFVLFAARLLLIKSGKTLSTDEEAKKLAMEAVALVARACGQHKAVAHYQMFRSPRTKDKIVSELSGKQGDFFTLIDGLS